MNQLDHRYIQANQGDNHLQIIERTQPVNAPTQSLINPNLGRWISRWGICFAIGLIVPSVLAIAPWIAQVTIVMLLLITLGLVGGMVVLNLKDAIPYCLACLVGLGSIILSWVLILHKTLEPIKGAWF